MPSDALFSFVGTKGWKTDGKLGLWLFVEAVGDDNVDAEDAAGVDEDLGEDVEDAVVDFAGRGEEQCYEGEDDAEDEHRYGGVFFESGFHGCKGKFTIKLCYASFGLAFGLATG